jgi:hypothetical protein
VDKQPVDKQPVDVRLKINMAQKVTILSSIKMHANTIFDENATQPRRNKGWRIVIQDCLDIGVQIRDICHIRTIFNNWKRVVKAKLLKSTRTGEGGQPPHTEAEQLMIDILYGSKKLRNGLRVHFFT